MQTDASKRNAMQRSRRWAWATVLSLVPPAAAGCASDGHAQAGMGTAQAMAAKPDPGDAMASADGIEGFKAKIGLVPLAPPPPAESVVLRPDGIMPDTPPKAGSPEAKLAGARELFRAGEYSKAEALFKWLADKKTTPVAVAEEARYYQAESLRLEGRWPKAADVYNDLLMKFPSTNYREQALQHMYDIANIWLDDTRVEMEQTKEKTEGKRWFVAPHFIHFDKEKPLLDTEGRAIEKLEQVRYNDVNGPLADKALFLAGSVKFFNEDYKDADNYFSQIHEKHPNSALAPQAVELAIISKHLSTGGAEYDGRKVAEARKLVQSAFNNYPELASKKKDFLTRQLVGITLQQAEKDYKMAEFWKRTGHPGSAYWYYEMVKMRYPNTKFAQMADDRIAELKIKAEKDGNVLTAPTNGAQLGRPAPMPAETAPPPRRAPEPTEQAPPPRTLPPGIGQQ